MIDLIRQAVRANLNRLPTEVRAGEYRFSKFHHGRAAAEDKVLFLATKASVPAFILKLARTASGNECLRREYAALEEMRKLPLPVAVPEPYFESELEGMALTAEQVLSGPLLSRSEAPRALPAVIAFIEALPKEKNIRASRVLVLFAAHSGDEHYRSILAEGEAYGKCELHFAPCHGDLTFRNVMCVDAGFAFIDWGDTDAVPLWGIDLAHFAARLPSFDASVLPSGMDADYFSLLSVLDRAADRLKKTDTAAYRSLGSALSKLRAETRSASQL